MINEKDTANRLLAGLENGTLRPHEAAGLAENLDPVLICFIVRFLRECYPASDPVAPAVLERVVALMSASRDVVARIKEGEQDPITRWLVENHSFREYRGRGAELIALIVDKLET